MKSKLLIVFLLVPMFGFSQVDFNKHFKNKSLRFDFLLGGNSEEVVVYPQEMKQEPFWGGPKTNTIDSFAYGSYRFLVFDKDSEELIFSKGFSTLFQEWQTTAEAKETDKAFYQSAIFPFPKNEVVLKIQARQWNGEFETLYSTNISPKNYFILHEEKEKVEVNELMLNGDPSDKVDVVFLAEGYTKNEMDKFVKDAKRLMNGLLSVAPYTDYKTSFNFYAVLSPSLDSGTDIPGEFVYKNTRFNTGFYTFDLPRYLTSSDMKSIYDVASAAPYDQICLLVNSERYGGGGFYNFVSVCTADSELAEKVFIHEFGHGFAGLADEYYTSDVAYEDFYNLEIEPWEPNITTLVNFDIKWKDLLDKGTPIPTARNLKNSNKIGVYEGGGYMSKGIYSPMMDCRMKSNATEDFCPACQRAIVRTIKFYSK